MDGWDVLKGTAIEIFMRRPNNEEDIIENYGCVDWMELDRSIELFITYILNWMYIRSLSYLLKALHKAKQK